MSKTWKARERSIAKFFGTTRTPLSGINSRHGTSSDSLHPLLFIEAKHRKRHAVVRLWYKCKELAIKEKKIPVVALSEHGKPGFWIMVHSSDLLSVANQRNLVRKVG